MQGAAASAGSRRGPHIRVEGQARLRGVQVRSGKGIGARWVLLARGPSKGRLPLQCSRAQPHCRTAAAHALASAPRPCVPQAYRAGQFNVKGAYPFHFHFAGDASQSLVTDCSVYK